MKNFIAIFSAVFFSTFSANAMKEGVADVDIDDHEHRELISWPKDSTITIKTTDESIFKERLKKLFYLIQTNEGEASLPDELTIVHAPKDSLSQNAVNYRRCQIETVYPSKDFPLLSGAFNDRMKATQKAHFFYLSMIYFSSPPSDDLPTMEMCFPKDMRNKKDFSSFLKICSQALDGNEL